MIAFIFFGMESDFGLHWSLIFLLIPLFIRVKWDSALIRAGYEVQHTKHTIITMAMYAIISIPAWYLGPAKYFFQSFIFGGCIFAFSFDYLLDLSRHLKLTYVDQGLDGISSKEDSILKQMPWWGILFIKIWVLLFGFSVYFYWSYV
jgi:hypothetical protein